MSFVGGTVTISNNVIQNIFQPTQEGDGGGCITLDESWKTVIVSHNVCRNTYGSGITGNTSPNSLGALSGSSYVVDGNIVLNTCLQDADCGGIYFYDTSHTMVNCSWTNNIVGNTGSASNFNAKGIYLDDYTSNCAIHGNQIYGGTYMAFMFHAGNQNRVTNNLIDMSSIYSSSPNNQNVAYYQDDFLGIVRGYNGTMDGNTFQNNVVYSSVAPFTTSCGKLDCGYLWMFLQENTTRNPMNPTVSNNLYYSTVGSFTNYGSSPAQSSSVYGPISDSNPATGNPLISYTTGSYGERHYGMGSGSAAFATPVNFTVLQTGQGPH